MAAIALIIFREVLEMALVVGIVLAAARGVPGRNRWVSLGLGGGAAGSLALAGVADKLAEVASGMGQEYFNAIILTLATALIAQTVIWMQKHGRDMANTIKAAGQAVARGEQPVRMLALVVGLAVLREGAEAVLFINGILASQSETIATIVAGVGVGLALGALAGGLLYRGLLVISPRHLFTVTSVMLSLLAAGMAAQAAGMLQQVDLLPSLVDPLWDSSALLSQSSPFGRVLGVLIGYQDRPSAMQVIIYVLCYAGITGGRRLASRPVPPRPVAA